MPNSGGQIEIVGNRSELIYDNTADAAGKILDVIRHKNRQRVLLEYLRTRKNLFTEEKFVQTIQYLAGTFLMCTKNNEKNISGTVMQMAHENKKNKG